MTKKEKWIFDLDYRFFNPKAGVNVEVGKKAQLYASYGIAHREPTRSDIIDNDELPTAERLDNLEVGYRRRLDNWQFNANYYYMNYRDQLVLTGNLNSVGAPVQQNVPKSYRMGIELVSNWKISNRWSWRANATFSRNKIHSFSQTTAVFSPNFDYLRDTTIEYRDTDISFSPNFIAAFTVAFQPTPQWNFSFNSKYVGSQYLDNTQTDSRRLDAYFTHHLQFSYQRSFKWCEELQVNLLVNNFFNTLYEPNGWTYFLLFEEQNQSIQATDYNNYYPQAGTNFLVGLNLRF